MQIMRLNPFENREGFEQVVVFGGGGGRVLIPLRTGKGSNVIEMIKLYSVTS